MFFFLLIVTDSLGEKKSSAGGTGGGHDTGHLRPGRLGKAFSAPKGTQTLDTISEVLESRCLMCVDSALY